MENCCGAWLILDQYQLACCIGGMEQYKLRIHIYIYVYIDYYIMERTRDQVLIVDIDTYLQTKSAYGIDYLILST